MPLSRRTTGSLREVLAAFGISDAVLHDIRRGRVNKHWRVETETGVFALRRYNEHRTRPAIEYEHHVLRYLFAKGWPVAPPIAQPGDAGCIISTGGRSYSLFPYLPGRPSSSRRVARAVLNGRLLARLHQEMAGWDAPGQRDGFGRIWELDVYVAAQCRFRSLSDLLMAFGREHPDLARAVRAQKYAMLRELSTLGYGELPVVLGHFDFHEDNLLFERGALTGVLDFDLIHLDSRVADIAESIALGCLTPPAYDEIDPAAASALLSSYTEHTRLSDAELQLVSPLCRAVTLWMVTWRLCQWAEDQRDARPLRSIQRSVSRRFPALARLRPALEAAVLQSQDG